jgi:hypothetical protein
LDEFSQDEIKDSEVEVGYAQLNTNEALRILL